MAVYYPTSGLKSSRRAARRRLRRTRPL